MNALPFGDLPPFVPRRFVPPAVALDDWAAIAPWFDRLEDRAAESKFPADLEAWLHDWSELSSAIDEEGARRHIAMTCHTEDAASKQAYLDFVERIEPELKARQFRLSELFLKHPLRKALPKERYEVFDRDTAVTVELFRTENVSLETEETRLGQQYYELTGAMTVQFRGEERTLQQMSKFLEEPERATRQEAWELVVQRRLADAEQFESIFDAMLQCRERIAANAGFKDYLSYAWRRLRRFDYKPAQCVEFHTAIEQEILPVVRELQEERRAQLGVATLRPWDLDADPLGRAPLKPFANVPEMLERTQRLFDQLDGELAAGFRQMRELHLLDLDSRKGKAPGGYQSTLNESRLPFIFMHAVGVQRDVETLLHEAGHAFHALASQSDPLLAYRGAPIEFCEVASMSMELLGNEDLGEFYTEADARRARRSHLELIPKIFPWIATVDAFQHWIYTHPGHTRAERTAAWVALMDRFGGAVDWSGLEAARANLWHRQLHIFQLPFYYVEYGIAQLGALAVWANSRRDRAGALAAYKRGLALGGARPLPELFEAAGCRFEFSAKTVRPLMERVREELAGLRGA
ncbi:MAG TPA: M3 family oligoendopeptidase [Verrucomicrobiae bacterium]|nr:M3 family oligoendopeptidase [Verrucomicrobiae bacterium]